MTAQEFYKDFTQEQREKVNRWKKRTPYKSPSKRQVIKDGYIGHLLANINGNTGNLMQGQMWLVNAMQTGLQNMQVEANKISKIVKKNTKGEEKVEK